MEISITKEGWEKRLKQAQAMVKQYKDELLMWELMEKLSLKELEKFPKTDLPEGVKTIDQVR